MTRLYMPAGTNCKPNENVCLKNLHFIYAKRIRHFEVKLILSSAGKASIKNTHLSLVSISLYLSYEKNS